MVASMTAFARQSGQGDWGRATWELRSVNHRYLEASLRLPEELRSLEVAIRERIDRHVKRGKLDCILRLEGSTRIAPQLNVNQALVRQLIDAGAAINKSLDDPAPVNAMDLLRWPGVIATEPPNVDALGGELLAILERTLGSLVEARLREGGKLRAFIESRCGEAEAKVQRLREQLPAILEGLKRRMYNRIAELTATMDASRLEQETALLLQKLDVAEELDRLVAHIHEVRRVLREDGLAGRRLDFLMQEMHREANTLGAKSAHLDTTGTSLDLKVLIEQMREQVQNIE